MPSLREIPSIDELLQRDALASAIARHGRDVVVRAARKSADDLRARLKRGAEDAPNSSTDAASWLERATLDRVAASLAPSLLRVVNATGVILHTNLGRAPLAADAVARAAAIGAASSNLEYDLDAGTRGHRHVHAERLLCDLTGAEAALVVNNNAAAALVVLAALGAGREVIVSRGELVEIGGGFRVPDVLTQSGAQLREVGTTNRTRVGDYAAAIGDRTALLLRVHPSNFTIEGFTARPSVGELAALAHRFNLLLVEDLGSGWLGLDDTDVRALAGEPSVRASLAAGADVVAFSGDKLLGGPQAGIVVGRAAAIDRVRHHPLVRAVRADKLAYAALEATLTLWAQPTRRHEIPVYRMLTLTAAEIEARAQAVIDQLRDVKGLTCRIVDGSSTTGGGSAPESALATRLIALTSTAVAASALDTRLRAGDPPVVARIENDAVLIDLRTVDPVDDVVVTRMIAEAASSSAS